jgi:RNA polymerase sigma factor (sigma-70 family)
MKKRFNDYWAPHEFQSYMSRLEDEVRKLEIGANYKELNQTLIQLWKEESDPRRKDDIRNYLVLANLRLAHELLIKKLNPDFSQSDAIDILQEINLGLVEVITWFLEENEDSEFFSTRVWDKLCGKLRRIVKTYYEAKDFEQANSSLVEDFEDEKNEIEEKIEKNYAEIVSSRCLQLYCTGREETFLRETYGIQSYPYCLEEIGCRYGLSRERVRQIDLKGIERIKSKYTESEVDPVGHTGYTFFPEKYGQRTQCRAKADPKVIEDPVLGNLTYKCGKKYTYFVSSGYPVKTLLDRGINPKSILVIDPGTHDSRITPYHFVFDIKYIENYKMDGLILKSIEKNKFLKVNLFQEIFPTMCYNISEQQISRVKKEIMEDRTILYGYFDRECLKNWKPCKKSQRSSKYYVLDESSSMEILAKLILLRKYVES